MSLWTTLRAQGLQIAHKGVGHTILGQLGIAQQAQGVTKDTRAVKIVNFSQGGLFETINGSNSRRYLVKTSPGGSVDPLYNPAPSSSVRKPA